MTSELLIESSLRGELRALLESIFIFEGRIDFLKDKHKDGIDSSHDSLAKHREPHDIIDHFASNADPSKKKIYTQKIVDWYKNKDFRQEDHGRVRQTLRDFETHKKKLPHSDIGKYKSFGHLDSALESFRVKPTEMKWGEFSQDDLNHVSGKGATVIHDDHDYTVREVHDQRAMDLLGKGTEWCTVTNKHRGTPEDGVGDDSSYFTQYAAQGKFHHIHDKKSGDRYLVHDASDQYMDANDDPSIEHISKNYASGLSKIHMAGINGEEEARIKVASSPFANSAQLDYLHNDVSPNVRGEVADNPNTPSRILHKMGGDSEDYVRSVVAGNENSSKDLLHSLSDDHSAEVRQAVALSKSARSDTLHKLSTDSDDNVRMSVANNQATGLETLSRLHNDPKTWVRVAVAKHGNSSGELLHRLSKDGEYQVRAHVAGNKNSTHDTLLGLVNDSDPSTRTALAGNPSTNPDILHTLADDKHRSVRLGVVKQRKTRPETLHKFHKDPEFGIRRRLLLHPSMSLETRHAMSSDKDDEIRLLLAAHHDLEPRTLHALHDDKVIRVRNAVASNKKLSPETLHLMSRDKSHVIRRLVAKHPNTKEETLRDMHDRGDELWGAGMTKNYASILKSRLKDL